MCESQVSGCQLLTLIFENAQWTPDQVSPFCTTGFCVTYKSSS